MVRNGDEHEFVPGPDMEMVRRDGEPGFRVVFAMISSWNSKLTPQRVDIFLLIVHAGVLHHVKSYCGMGAVCANEEVKGDFYLFISRLKCFLLCPGHFEPGLLPLEVGSGKLVAEE